jgi:hypothetical protein
MDTASTSNGEAYHAECSCGWSIRRDARESNLPKENNRELVEKVASIHKNRPRFGDASKEKHFVSGVQTIDHGE